jgi:hypothetical protein
MHFYVAGVQLYDESWVQQHSNKTQDFTSTLKMEAVFSSETLT